jgi:type VI secretion system protein ImpL
MPAILPFLLSRWFLTFVATALLAVLVWLFGPLLIVLESSLARLLLILVMFALWAGINLVLDLSRRRREAALQEGVAKAAPDPAAAASAEEAAALREKLAAALGLLKKARGTRGYLYEQPWYVIIGPPGAGKTTALLNAGLSFPLAAEMGQGGVAGVGGTRLCEWWFTEDAVLIDTAGRYTTQDSDAAVDKAGWEAFLDLLKRTRTRQPLNGVVVAIAASELAVAPREERLAHARAVRRRVKEIEERLAVRLPVYAVFTKTDLIAGFTEFFDDLDRDRRAQAWGATFPLEQQAAGLAGAFPAEFRALTERLDQRLFDRLQAERSPDRRALIAGFPAQVGSLEQPIAEFLAEAFGGSRLDPAPMLRGFYLTSGTQEGTPIDRLTGALARTFGVDQRRVPSLKPQQGRSYFLTRLIKEVIFGEAMLVSEQPGAARRRMMVRAGAYAAALLVVLCGAGLMWSSEASNRREVAGMAAALAAYDKTAAGLPLDPVADADLPRIVPLLDEARALPHGYDAKPAATPSWLQFGLSQEAKLGAGARTVYRHALERVLLPRLIWRLEPQMRGKLDQPDFLYEATRVYLMLGSAGPLDRNLVEAWESLDWQATYPGPVMAPLRADLGRHLDVLLASPLPQVPLDGALVEAARTTFSRVPLADRVYSRIRPSAAAQAIPAWTPAAALGAAGVRVFARASGKPLTDGIPGFFTVDGFRKVLLPALGNVAKDVAGESWVLGQRTALDPTSPQVRALEHDVIALYEADYARQWDAMLADLNIVPLRTLPQAAQDLYVLASPQSPVRDLLASAVGQLDLGKPPPEQQGAKGATQPPAQGVQAQLKGLLGGSPVEGTPPAPPGQEISDRYKPLRNYVGSGPGAPIDQAFKAMNDLQQQLAKMASTAPGSVPPPAPSGADPVLEIKAEAERAPEPVSRWLQAMVVSSGALRAGGAKAQAGAAFNGPGGPATICKAIAGRYPFNPKSPDDVPIDDFARLFAPGGMLDGFFNAQLKPYVDMSGPTWKAQALDGVQPPVTPAALALFQRAAKIRDTFFPTGATPSVRFDLTPTFLDDGAKQVTLDLGGTPVTYAHGPLRATQITWPGPAGMSTVRLVFEPPPASGAAVLQASGPWALFRLFDQGNLQQAGSSDRYTVTFPLGERKAVFDIRAGSVLNPFAGEVLHGFSCPSVQ